MAPKQTSTAEKQQKILNWFHATLTVHSLKDLEKAIPSIAGVHAMAVKDLIQALVDENFIRVEKIGSGNWYWSFRSEEKRNKEQVLAGLDGEAVKLTAGIGDVEGLLETETEKRGDGEGGMDRKALLEADGRLVREIGALERELAGYSDNDPTEIERKVAETKLLRESAMKWHDNVENLECFLASIAGKDKAGEIMEQICGAIYTRTDGLREL